MANPQECSPKGPTRPDRDSGARRPRRHPQRPGLIRNRRLLSFRPLSLTPSSSIQTALRRVQVPLALGAGAVLLSIPIGVILLALGDSEEVDITAGILLLVFCAAGILGVVVAAIYLRLAVRVARSQTEFLASVSHELRTPMTSMRMFVDALRDQRLGDAQREECLGTLRTELIRLDRLVARLMAVARLEAAPGAIEFLPLRIEDLVRDAAAAHETLRLGTPDLGRLNVDLEPGLWVLGDRDSLVQALANLLSNAHNHGDPKLDILVKARDQGEMVDLGVIDQGPGLTGEEVRTVFERFQRGRAAEAKGTPGSGLGLGIIEGITKAHGGRLELRQGAGDGKGCAFHLILPKASDPNAADGVDAPSSTAGTSQVSGP